MSKYTEKDAAKDTKSSTKEVDGAWHKAREDATESGHLKERQSGGSGPKDECNQGHKK